MDESSVTITSPGFFNLKGHFTLDTIQQYVNHAPWVSSDIDTWECDLGFVDKIDSAGLGLLINWAMAAKKHNKKLCFKNVPPKIHKIATIYGIDSIIFT